MLVQGGSNANTTKNNTNNKKDKKERKRFRNKKTEDAEMKLDDMTTTTRKISSAVPKGSPSISYKCTHYKNQQVVDSFLSITFVDMLRKRQLEKKPATDFQQQWQ